MTPEQEKKLLIIREWLQDYRVNATPHNKNELHYFIYYEKYRRLFPDFVLRFDLWFSRESISGFGIWVDGKTASQEQIFELLPTDLKVKWIFISEAKDND